eukprot:scaffold1722_cov380-Prasinococcus_capsulatus_cf.AAC.10
MSDSDDDDREGLVVGFMFGNVDKKGRLEEEYLDEDAKETIENLGGDAFQLGDTVNAVQDAKATEEDKVKAVKIKGKSANAVDYEGIDEAYDDSEPGQKTERRGQPTESQSAATATPQAQQPPLAGSTRDGPQVGPPPGEPSLATPTVPQLHSSFVAAEAEEDNYDDDDYDGDAEGDKPKSPDRGAPQLFSITAADISASVAAAQQLREQDAAMTGQGDEGMYKKEPAAPAEEPQAKDKEIPKPAHETARAVLDGSLESTEVEVKPADEPADTRIPPTQLEDEARGHERPKQAESILKEGESALAVATDELKDSHVCKDTDQGPRESRPELQRRLLPVLFEDPRDGYVLKFSTLVKGNIRRTGRVRGSGLRGQRHKRHKKRVSTVVEERGDEDLLQRTEVEEEEEGEEADDDRRQRRQDTLILLNPRDAALTRLARVTDASPGQHGLQPKSKLVEWEEQSGTPLAWGASGDLEAGKRGDPRLIEASSSKLVRTPAERLGWQLARHMDEMEGRLYAYHPDDWEEQIIWDEEEKRKQEREQRRKANLAQMKAKSKCQGHILHPGTNDEEEEIEDGSQDDDVEAVIEHEIATDVEGRVEGESVLPATVAHDSAKEKNATEGVLVEEEAEGPRQPRKAAARAAATAAAIAAEEELDRQREKEKQQDAKKEQVSSAPMMRPDDSDEEDEVMKAEREALEKARQKHASRGRSDKVEGSGKGGRPRKRSAGGADSDFDPEEEEEDQLKPAAKEQTDDIFVDGQGADAGGGAGGEAPIAEGDGWDDLDAMLDEIDGQQDGAGIGGKVDRTPGDAYAGSRSMHHAGDYHGMGDNASNSSCSLWGEAGFSTYKTPPVLAQASSDGRTTKPVHEQLLRFHLNLLPSESDVPLECHNQQHRFPRANRHLCGDRWLKDTMDRLEQGTMLKVDPVVLDLNDGRMVFQRMDNSLTSAEESRKATEELKKCAALILPSAKQLELGKAPESNTVDVAGPDEEATGPELTSQTKVLGEVHMKDPLSVSNDHHYVKKAKTKEKGAAQEQLLTKVVHALPAIKLETVAALGPSAGSQSDLASRFHRFRSVFHRRKVVRTITSEDIIIVKSLAGRILRIHFSDTDRPDGQVDDSKLYRNDMADRLVTKVRQSWSDVKAAQIRLWAPKGKLLKPGVSLQASGVVVGCNIVCSIRRVEFLPSKTHNALPKDDRPIRPPAAFKKLSDLHARDGKVILMEYIDEHPLFLSREGMGAKMVGYYRKRHAGDVQDVAKRLSGAATQWVNLEPSDPSPFVADVKPGASVTGVETNMFRAACKTHPAQDTDLLLIRTAQGRLYIREMSSTVTVGQIEPQMEVMVPHSKTESSFIENRIQIQINREFRSLIAKMPGANSGNGPLAAPPGLPPPCISLARLKAGLPQGISDHGEHIILKKLKQVADVNRKGEGVLKDGLVVPAEEELHRLVPPEQVCSYESMQDGYQRLIKMGVTRLVGTQGLHSAAQLVSVHSEAKKAAAFIEKELLLAPWNVTASFMLAMQGKGVMQVTGFGDPSGRGKLISYLTVQNKETVSAPDGKKIGPKNGSVTGTDADLRKLSMKDSEEILLKYGMTLEEIKKLKRWERIGAIRNFSTQATQEGQAGASRFARQHRISMSQQMQTFTAQSQKVFDAGLKFLDEGSDTGDEFEDADEFADDLEGLLEEEEGEKEEDEKKILEQMRKSGLLDDKGENELDQPKIQPTSAEQTNTEEGKQPEKPKMKRRRKVLKVRCRVIRPDGSEEDVVEVIVSPQKVAEFLARQQRLQQRKPQRVEEGRGQAAGRRMPTAKQPGGQRKRKKKAEDRASNEGAQVASGNGGETPAQAADAGKSGKRSTRGKRKRYTDDLVIEDASGDDDTWETEDEDETIDDDGPPIGRSATLFSLKQTPKKKSPKAQLAALLVALVDSLLKNPQIYIFHVPVLPSDENYHRKIENPMDFLKIKTKAQRYLYRSRSDFQADIELVYDNCYSFNHSFPDYLKQADLLERLVEVR